MNSLRNQLPGQFQLVDHSPQSISRTTLFNRRSPISIVRTSPISRQSPKLFVWAIPIMIQSPTSIVRTNQIDTIASEIDCPDNF